MGAYANPQEIEGQQDPGAYSKPLQKMFDTITAGAMNASDNITKIKLAQSERILQENKIRATKNDTLLKELDQKQQGLQVLLAKGQMNAPKGLNYDCYNIALKDWEVLQTKIDKGEGTAADKRTVAQILASVDGFVKGAADTSGIIEKIKVARNNIGDGQIDKKGTDPDMLRAYIALENKDGETIMPAFNINEDGTTNYLEPGYNLFPPAGTDGSKGSPKFISATKLNESLNGGANGGVIFQKSFESDNKKVRDAYKASEDGGGIFEYKGAAFTNKVTPAYLSNSYTRSTQLGTQGTGGITRQPMRLVNKEKILENVGTTIDGISAGAASNPNEVASRYFNYVLPAINDKNPNKEAYKSLPDFAKFAEMPKGFDYGSVINIDDKEGQMKIINKNSRAAFAQSIPNSQAYGNPITISDKDLLWEKDANSGKVPKELLKDWNKVKEAKGDAYEIKTIKLGDGKIRNVLISKDQDGKVFLEIVGYNTNQ